jgi:hypothetical protein
MQNDFKQIQLGVDGILNTKTIVRRKKKTTSEKKRELFNNLIMSLEEMQVRQTIMYIDLGLDFSTYNEGFYSAIDMLLNMNFGEKGTDVIGFYLYDRLNPDGTENALLINGKEEVILKNPYELWNFLCKMDPTLDE